VSALLRSRIRSERRQVALAGVLAASLIVIAACSGESEDPVETGPVGRSDVTEIVEAPATVVARGSATVTAPADGEVRRLRVRDGAEVRKGELIMTIASPSARRALADAREADAAVASSAPAAPSTAGLSSSVSRADRAARRAFDRAEEAAKDLPTRDARRAALAQLRAAEAQYASARRAVDDALDQVDAGVGSVSSAVGALSSAQRIQTRAALEAAQRTVDALEVRAPIAGTITFGAPPGASSGGGSTGGLSSLLGQLPDAQQDLASSFLGDAGAGASAEATGEIARGAPVSSGQPLLTVTDVSRLSLAAQVDETDVLLVEDGIAAEVELSAVPGAVYGARVTSVGLSPTTSARGGVTYEVRLRLRDGELGDGERAPAPRPGMSAVAALQVRTAEDAVSVPAAAVFQDQGQTVVWRVDEDGLAERRVVRLGAQGEATYEVVRGLTIEDVVVVRGADRVRAGQSIG
jgi:multidrug efflux pump subunit AcrA (membrane-fusion protein)